MPELPDVETFKRYVDTTALHHEIVDTSVSDKRILEGVSAKALASRVRGATMDWTARHGKYLFIRLAPGRHVLVLHFGMTGELTYYKNGKELPPYTRVLFALSDGYRLAYQSRRMLGRVTLTEDVSDFITRRELGPDAMSDELTPSRFARRLAEKRGTIKAALMDQSFIAGLGNVYVDETLFHAGIHPKTPIDQLGEREAKELFHTLRRVLKVTIRHRADPDRFPASYLTRHRDDGECPRCGGTLNASKVSGRTSYFCTKCQPAR